jgi:Mg-chelatase subunit ChlD
VISKRSSVGFIIVLASAIFLPLSSSAGNGRFENGEYNFCVSVRFDANESQLDQIESSFEEASQVLADATDGQQRFGTITIVNDSGASRSAEYWINPGSNGARATAGRYGVRGQHVNFYYDTYFDDRSQPHGRCPSAGAVGIEATAYSIAHEHAHHSWGVLDEYSGPGGRFVDGTTGQLIECAPPPDTAALNYSLMDNYYCRGGRASGGAYTLNEFCVASNHDPDGDNAQDPSAWEAIAAHQSRAATAPTGLPTSAPPPTHTVDFLTGFAGLKTMLLIDRSGSMGSQQRMVFARRGAKTFLSFMPEQSQVGVASFSSAASVNFPLTTITGSATIDAAKASVDALSASGSTNIGGGLLTALGEIKSQATRSCDEIIVLLSDGDHNTGTSPASALAQLRQEGVTVLSVGVGSGISTSGQATLQTVATETGGRYFRVANSFDLVGLFLRLAMESLGNGLLNEDPLVIASGQIVRVPVLVEAGAESALFALAFADPIDDITLSLESPSGTVISEDDVFAEPNLQLITEENFLAFEVLAPEAGIWNIVLSASSIRTGTVEILAFAQSPGLDLNLATSSNLVVFPDGIEVEATPTFEGTNVVGADVLGSVRRPDGSSVAITLRDDGIVPDIEAGDGSYTASFNDYTEDGTYIFDVVAQNLNGVKDSGEPLEALLVPGPPESVPAFTRRASTAVVVTGVPDFLVATVEYGPETINLKSRGRFVTAYVELPEGIDASDIVQGSIEITAIDGSSIVPISAEVKPLEVGDFDNDGVSDLMVKFDRSALQEVLASGMRAIELRGFADDQLFVGERTVTVINPGK